jgi:predicted metal-dependent hydrolase
VTPDNKVIITAPDNLSNKEIEAIIKRKDKWIRSKIEFNKQVKYPYKPKECIFR